MIMNIQMNYNMFNIAVVMQNKNKILYNLKTKIKIKNKLKVQKC